MDAIPKMLKPVVKRLEELPDLTRDQLISIIFVIRLGDELHRSFYGTFLTQSLIKELCLALDIPDLTVEVEVFATRWDFRSGTVSTTHSIAPDYDMAENHELSKIGWAVLEKKVTPQDGLRAIRDKIGHAKERGLESYYRDFPGRALLVPLMSSTCATVYFNGTWTDFGFAAACGAASGIVVWIADKYEHMSGIMDYLAAIVTAMISTAAVTSYPDSTCFSAQVLGTLYWFLYGTAYVLSLYEITNNQLMTGVARFVQALLRSYGLAFASVLGVWLAGYGGSDRWEAVDSRCALLDSRITDDRWYLLLFPLSAIACLMQFRVKLVHFPICLIVQCVAYGFQYLIGTVWEQPEFLANLVPAYLATITSHLCIVSMHKLKLYNLGTRNDAYLEAKKKTDSEAADEEMTKQAEEASLADGAGEGVVHDSDVFAYVSDREGYAGKVDKLQYASSDLWFCLLPALYLLVPGSKLLQTAFEALVSTLDDDAILPGNLDALAGSLLIVGLGQVMGLRLGFTTLWLGSVAWSWFTCEI